MKKKYIFLFSTVILGFAFYGDDVTIPTYAQQAILNPQNPREEIVPEAPMTSEATTNSSVKENHSDTSTSMSQEKKTDSTIRKSARSERNQLKPRRKKVFVTDELFPSKELPVTLNSQSGGANNTSGLNFYTQLCYNLSGSALYGCKAGT